MQAKMQVSTSELYGSTGQGMRALNLTPMAIDAPRRIYAGDIVAGSLLVNESRHIAELLLGGASEEVWRRALFVDNVLQKRNEATVKRQSQLIRKRLDVMDEGLWKIVINGTSEVTRQALLAATIKASRLLGDFLAQVIKPKLRRFDRQVSRNDWRDFFEECRQLDPHLDGWSEATRSKVGEVILRTLAEAGYLSDTRALRIQPVTIVSDVREYLSVRGESYVLNCMELTS